MEGANLVYNKTDGSGAAVRLRSDNRVRDDIFARQANALEQGIADKKRATKERSDRVRRLMEDFSASGGFYQDQEDTLERIRGIEQRYADMAATAGGWNDEIERQLRDDIRKENVYRERRTSDQEYYASQIEAAQDGDYDPDSMDKLQAWKQASFADRMGMERPSLKPLYTGSMSSALERSSLGGLVLDTDITTSQGGYRTKQTQDYGMSNDELIALNKKDADSAFNMAHDPNVAGHPQDKKNSEFLHEAIQDSGALNGLTPGTDEYAAAWKKGHFDLMMRYKKGVDAETNKNTQKPYPVSKTKTPKPYGHQNDNSWRNKDFILTPSSDSDVKVKDGFPTASTGRDVTYTVNRDSKSQSGEAPRFQIGVEGRQNPITAVVKDVTKGRDGKYRATLSYTEKGNIGTDNEYTEENVKEFTLTEAGMRAIEANIVGGTMDELFNSPMETKTTSNVTSGKRTGAGGL